MLALTGDAEFNRDLRQRAHRMGLHLNEWGLWRWDDAAAWARVPVETEADVLSELGLGWVEPARRNFGLLGLGKTPKAKGRPRKQPDKDWSVDVD